MQTEAHPKFLQTARDGLKPRRGGLFIANEHPEIILFVFRRRGFCELNAHQEVAPYPVPGMEPFTAPRRRKTKRK